MWLKGFIEMKSMLLALACICSAGLAQAAVVNVDVTTPATGTWEVYTGAGPIGTNQFNEDGVVYTLEESQGVTVPVTLTTFGGTVPAGTVVDSTLVWVDPSVLMNTQATIDFSSDIVGIIVGSVTLFLTESLFGSDVVTYFYDSMTGLERIDRLFIVDENTITINFWTDNPGDYIRVLTATPIPVPAAGLMLLAGLGALGAMRRRSPKTAALAA